MSVEAARRRCVCRVLLVVDGGVRLVALAVIEERAQQQLSAVDVRVDARLRLGRRARRESDAAPPDPHLRGCDV